MSVEMAPVKTDSDLMRAWESYRVSSEFRNSFKHAADLEYRTGSMWAAFVKGYEAAGGKVEF